MQLCSVVAIPEYPPESLRTIVARLQSRTSSGMPPPEPDSDLSIANRSGLVRIKQEILDQSNLSSEDLRINDVPAEPTSPIQVEYEHFSLAVQ